MIRPAVARIDSPTHGTAFAIDAHTALTACHNLFEDLDDCSPVAAVDLCFPGEEAKEAELLEYDATEDWAVLELREPLAPALRPFGLQDEVLPGEVWRCLGFPRAAVEFGLLPLRVIFSGETERNGAPVLTLESLAVASGLNPQGLSGAPVLRPNNGREEVVGLVIRRLLDPDREGEQVGGLLFACPIHLFADVPSLSLKQAIDAGLPASPEEGLAMAAERDIGAAGRLGHLLLTEGRREEAEPLLRRAALGGDPEAAYTVGILIDPDGTMIDYDAALAAEALGWFRRAATAGDVFGATTMGIRLRQHGRNDAALPWLEEAVERGDTMAAHTLGRVYEDLGDREEAERLERVAAEQGDVRAAFDLGRLLNDRGERQQATQWLLRATLDSDAVALLRALDVDPEQAVEQ